MEYGQAVSCGLARAGMGLADHVMAGQEHWNQSRLDRRGCREAKRFYGLHQLRVQV